MIRLDFEATEADAADALRAVERIRSGRWTWRLVRAGLPTMVAGLLLLAVFDSATWLFAAALPGLILAVKWRAFLGLTAPGVAADAGRLLPRERRHQVLADQRGIEWRSTEESEWHSWSGVREVLELEQTILVVTSSGRALYIPRSAVAGEQLAELRRLAASTSAAHADQAPASPER